MQFQCGRIIFQRTFQQFGEFALQFFQRRLVCRLCDSFFEPFQFCGDRLFFCQYCRGLFHKFRLQFIGR
ncbi:MAG: zinc-ribbon domain-containing protein, partial [Lentisphaeria bacterium]|nr:zinc-ribbon domain-containing protein [Lentisphaeria bacterium]